MLWVDHQNYFGPDRRGQARGFRLRERRRMNCAGHPPRLRAALTQLQLHVIDAHGEGVDRFVERTRNMSLLADMNGERQTSLELSSLSARVARNRDADMRPAIYESVGRAQALLLAA